MTLGKKGFIIATLLMLFFIFGCSQKDKYPYIDFNKTNTAESSSINDSKKKTNVLRIGLVSRMGLEKDIFDFTPICKILKQQTGMHLEIKWYRSSFELNEQLPFNLSDIIITPASSFLWGADENNLEPLLEGVPLKPVKGLVIVPGQSEIQKINQLYDKNFAVVDPISNSEGLYVAYLLKSINQNSDMFFRSYFSTYNNRNAIQLVAANKVAGAAVEDIALEQLISEDLSLKEKIKVIYTGPETRGLIVAARKSLTPSLKATIKNAMLTMSQNQETAEQLKKVNLKAFKPVNKEDYRQMSEVIRTVRE